MVVMGAMRGRFTSGRYRLFINISATAAAKFCVSLVHVHTGLKPQSHHQESKSELDHVFLQHASFLLGQKILDVLFYLRKNFFLFWHMLDKSYLINNVKTNEGRWL